MNPIAFALRHESLTHDLMTPVRIRGSHVSTERFSTGGFISCQAWFRMYRLQKDIIPSTHEYDFVKQIEQGAGLKKSGSKK